MAETKRLTSSGSSNPPLIWSECKTIAELKDLIKDYPDSTPVAFDRNVIILGHLNSRSPEEVRFRKLLRSWGYSPTKVDTVITTRQFCDKYKPQVRAYRKNPGRIEGEAIYLAVVEELTRNCRRETCLDGCHLQDPAIWAEHMTPYMHSKGREEAQAALNSITPRPV
jgi:hypothetical protein